MTVPLPHSHTSRAARRIHCRACLLALAWSGATATAAIGAPSEIMGLTEPYRTVDVAAAESGVIARLAVREGDAVTQGQLLAALDCETYVSQLAIAKQGMESKGRLLSARAELQLRINREKSFAAVFAKGHARPEEVQRTRTDLEMAQAQVLAVEEDLALRRLEYDKIQSQIEHRTVRAPVSAIVSLLHKEEGEFVAANSPTVLTLVQLDPLLAVFSLTSRQAELLRLGQEVPVHFANRNEPAPATVELISPVTDAKSGTIMVKFRIDNSRGDYRSGTRCTLQLPDAGQTDGG